MYSLRNKSLRNSIYIPIPQFLWRTVLAWLKFSGSWSKIYWRTKTQLFFLCFLQPASFISFSLCSLCRFTWMLVSYGLPLLDSCERWQWMCTIYCTHSGFFVPSRLVSRPFLIGKSDNIIKSYWHRHG